MEKIKIIYDTREQENKHILNYYDSKGIETVKKKLDYGDYTFEFNTYSFEKKIAVERKACIDELCNNFTRERERFRREFIRAYEDGSYLFLLIENASIDMINNHEYRSRMHPASLVGSLKSWKKKYNLRLIFCQKCNVAAFMYDLFVRYLNNN